jgi:hypothetical protein
MVVEEGVLCNLHKKRRVTPLFSIEFVQIAQIGGDPVEQELQIGQPAANPPAESKLDLGRWLGRHEALNMVARGCSGVDAVCLKKIREEKLYRDVAPNWDQFCKRELRSSRKKIDGVIGRLDEFGPAYFDLSRLTHVTADEYRQIAPAVGPEGVRIAGEVVAIAPDNQDKLDAAVAGVRKRRAKPAPKKADFTVVLDACRAALALIEKPPSKPDVEQKLELSETLQRIREAALDLGVLMVVIRL